MAAVLDRLVEQGLVFRQQAGRAYLHTLNRDHIAANAVEMLAGLRTELFQRLRQEIEAWKIQPVSAVLFGSTARGDGDVDSDVDLLVVRPESVDAEQDQWRDQLQALTDRVEAWTGNHAAIIELDASELPRLQHDEPPILASLAEDGVDLAGHPVRRLLRTRP